MKSLLSKFKSDAPNLSQVTSCQWAGLFIIHVIFGVESKNHILFISSWVFVNFRKEKLCFILKEKHNLNCAEKRLVQLSVRRDFLILYYFMQILKERLLSVLTKRNGENIENNLSNYKLLYT